MITAVVGKPGSGKTLYLVGQARKWLQQGFDVYSNVVIDEKEFKLKRKKNNNSTLYYYSELEDLKYIKNGKVILDEVGAYIDSRESANFPKEVRIKFQQHRKDGLDMFYSVQSYGRADLIIRQLTNDVIECHNLWNLIFYTTLYDADEYEAEKRKQLMFRFYIPNKKVIRAYDTLQSVNRKDKYEHTFKKMIEFFNYETNTAKV